MKDNSKVVTFKRLVPFHHEAQDAQALWYNQASLTLGSSWDSTGKRPNYGGLTFAELNVVMPTLVDAEPTEKDYRAKVTRYFHDISLKIKPDGTSLEIGLLLDNGKPLNYSETIEGKVVYNHPINAEDYILYRSSRSHPWCADSLKVGKSNPLKKVYIENKAEELADRKKETELKDVAMALYSSDKKDLDKARSILSILHKNYFALEDEDLLYELRGLATTKPKEYAKVSKDDKLSFKFFIKRLLNADIISKEGNYYMFDGQSLGVSTESVIQFLKDKGNSEVKNVLKARLESFSKNR